MERKIKLRLLLSLEKNFPLIVSATCLAIIYLLSANYKTSISFDKIQTIALQFCSISIGFLLTILTLIRGFKTPHLDQIKSRNENDYKRLISYIKSAIFNSIIAIVFMTVFSDFSIPNIEYYKQILTYLFLAFFSYILAEFGRLIFILSKALV